MTVTYRDGVAILALIFTIPALIAAVFLAFRHGFGRNSAWMFLILFTLIRAIGACFQLATINDPQNIDLYTGTAILNSIGLSPLMLVALGLLSRAISGIQKSYTTVLQPHHIKFVQLIVTVGFILAIVGGVNSGESVKANGSYSTQPLTQAAMGLFIAAYVLLAVATGRLALHVSYAEKEERRLVYAILATLPFLLVRLVYSSNAIFSNNPDFNPITGNVTIFLCMAVIMEIFVVLIDATVGLNLKRADSPLPNSHQIDDGRADMAEEHRTDKRPGFPRHPLAALLGIHRAGHHKGFRQPG